MISSNQKPAVTKPTDLRRLNLVFTTNLAQCDAVTEVLAPKFDATAGFQPTVLS
jgi:hypothetical protein